jgi:hypothetical protein
MEGMDVEQVMVLQKIYREAGSETSDVENFTPFRAYA